MNILLYHFVAAALWMGGLIAVLVVGTRRTRRLPVAVRRFSRLALVCWVVMAASGVVNAMVRVPFADLVDTAYGRLVLATIAALLALGVVGHRQRGHSVRAVTERGDGRSLVRLAGVEVLLMVATVGLATALERTPRPEAGSALPYTLELLVGYDLDGAPNLTRVVFGWRFDLVFGTTALLLAVLYLLGVRRVRRRGRGWPLGRTVAWLAGCLVLLIATSSGIGAYAPAMFSMHLASHTLLAVLAPVLLVLGGPVSLALRALPAAGRQAPSGPREWLTSFVRSGVCRLSTHPAVAFVLLIGPFYLLYFSGMFDAVLNERWARPAMNATFVLAGYLFFWPIIGVDPAPRRLPPAGRVGMMFGLLPAFGFLAVVLMNRGTAVGESYYQSLDLPWAADLLADQRLGGVMVWAMGELPVLVLLVVTASQWARADERDAGLRDRRADASAEADLAAYNAMLAELGQRTRAPD